MDVMHPRCAGLDVHKKTVVACVRRLGPTGAAVARTRSFGTTTAALAELAAWLAEAGVTHVAMEATGVYWKPVWHALEGRVELLLANAQHLKRVPGRKTDVQDAAWIAQLLQYGLLAPSFVPPRSVRELRDLTRERTQLIRHRAALANRIQKVLEDADIKLASVVTDVLGKTGRAILRALVAGVDDPVKLAELACGLLRKKRPQLREALRGSVTDHHRFQLRSLLDRVRQAEDMIERYSLRLGEVGAPFAAAAARLATIPGVSAKAAEVILAEVGDDMTRFPGAGHLASWAGLCPGNHESAGKRRGGRTTKGSRWLRATLVQVAWAAGHTKATALGAAYRRWARRLGSKRAVVAVAHKVLVLVYRLLKDQTTYVERHDPGLAA
jgi:transposase